MWILWGSTQGRASWWHPARLSPTGTSIGILIKRHILCFWSVSYVLRKFFDADSDQGSGIFLTLDPRSGMEKFGSGIKHPGSSQHWFTPIFLIRIFFRSSSNKMDTEFLTLILIPTFFLSLYSTSFLGTLCFWTFWFATGSTTVHFFLIGNLNGRKEQM